MTRWEKVSNCFLRIADELRLQRGATAHLASQVGRMCDILVRIETTQEEIHASHQRSIREIAGLEARVTKVERATTR
jgi:hypothetical protein